LLHKTVPWVMLDVAEMAGFVGLFFDRRIHCDAGRAYPRALMSATLPERGLGVLRPDFRA
jgi:hypothetical protein